MTRNKSIEAGSKGIKKPVNKRKPVPRRTVINTGSMHSYLRVLVRRSKPNQGKDQFRVSKKAASAAAYAVEDIMDLLIRNGAQLKDQIAQVKIFKPEHLLYAFDTWADVHLAVPKVTSRFNNIDRFVNKLDIRRRTTTGAAALSHAMKHANSSAAVASK